MCYLRRIYTFKKLSGPKTGFCQSLCLESDAKQWHMKPDLTKQH